MKLHENGVYLLNGTEIIEDNQEAAACLAAKTGKTVTAAEAATGTMAYRILKAHNTSGNMDHPRPLPWYQGHRNVYGSQNQESFFRRLQASHGRTDG